MTEEVLFAGRAFLEADVGVLAEMTEQFSEGAAYRAVLPPALDLAREHTRLFYAPGGAPCPPWQSTQGEEPVLMGAAHHSALAWYREAGMEPVAESEPADHIGLLLSFYGKLLAEDAPKEEVERFRAEHLGWMPAYCAKVAAETRLPFYRELAQRVAKLTEN